MRTLKQLREVAKLSRRKEIRVILRAGREQGRVTLGEMASKEENISNEVKT